jgi:flagellar motor switch protein FliG
VIAGVLFKLGARITPPTRSTQLEMLKWMDAKEVASLIEAEHPQIMAIVLAHLEAPIAADVLQHFPPAQARELTLDVMRNASNKIAVALRADAPRVEEGTSLYTIDADGQPVYS